MTVSTLDGEPLYSMSHEDAARQRDERLAALARIHLRGVTLDLSFLDGMTPEQERAICEEAVTALKNPALTKAIQYLISQQVDYTVKRAESMDHVLFGRATINGISLLKEQLEAMAARAEELRKGAEEFDEHKAL